MAYANPTFSGYTLSASTPTFLRTSHEAVTLPESLTGATRLSFSADNRSSFGLGGSLGSDRWRGSNIAARVRVGNNTADYTQSVISQQGISFNTNSSSVHQSLFAAIRASRPDISVELAWDIGEQRIRFGNAHVGGMAINGMLVAGAAVGDTLLWTATKTGSQGYTVPTAGQRAGNSFFEWAGNIPTRFDLGSALRGLLLETTNGGQAHIYFDRRLYARGGSWFWQSTQRPDPSDPSDAYQTQQFGPIDISSEVIATLGTVSGLYRYRVNLRPGDRVGSYTPTITRLIGVMARAQANNATFIPWASTLGWTES